MDVILVQRTSVNWTNKTEKLLGQAICGRMYRIARDESEFEYELKKRKLMESLKKNNDFLSVYRKGKSYANRYLVMYLADAPENNDGRIGISVSKKVGNSVVRHRVKRLIKESYRLNCKSLKTGYDIVIVARTAAKGKNYSDIASAFMHLARLHGLILTEEDLNERDDLN